MSPIINFSVGFTVWAHSEKAIKAFNFNAFPIDFVGTPGNFLLLIAEIIF